MRLFGTVPGDNQRGLGERMARMLAGNILIGVGVACYRVSLFGVDAYSCMNLGISGFLGMGFGTWQLLVNIGILLAVLLLDRGKIGPGTLVNMVCVGYIADGLCWLLLDVCALRAGLALRLAFLLGGTLLAAFGCALYMAADLGLSPYDSVAPILVRLSGEKLSFRLARVLSDLTVVCVGVGFCLAARNELREIVGLGTVINAFGNGPLIQFFRAKLR